MSAHRIGDRVRTGVYVLNEWVPMALGIVTNVSSDGASVEVDIMSLHGGAPWKQWRAATDVRSDCADARREGEG